MKRLPLPELNFRSGPEPFALVPEHSVDWHERQRLAEQRARHLAEQELKHGRLMGGELMVDGKTGAAAA